MPPLKNNPKLKRFNKLKDAVGVTEANTIMRDEFIEQAKIETKEEIKWVMDTLTSPFTMLKTAILIGGLFFVVRNGILNDKKNLIS
jgi:tellurite resistance protein